MITATIIRQKPPQKESVYPCLKEWDKGSKQQQFVVLFTSPKAGFVVHNITHGGSFGAYKIGYACDGWDEYDFIPFNGTVNLTNQ